MIWLSGDGVRSLCHRRHPPCEKKHIVILGGGFGGMTTAENLERVFGADRSIDFTLVSETNALLFTPMLAEVAGSSLEPTHISSPLRTSLRRTQVVRGKATQIDLERRRVTVAVGRQENNGADSPQEVPYDHLILALGAVSNYFGNQNIERLAFDFKSLLDAIRIRNHVIDCFEYADRETESAKRQELLTFVVAGGGFAGVELAGALNDFARGMLADYPNLRAEELRIILVHARDRILPELSEPLARYAQARMTERGVTFKLNTRLIDARPGAVILSPAEEIRAQTLVWTAGTAPNPLLKSLPVEQDKRGAVVVDSALRVMGQHGLWAVGDCAAATDAKSGKPCPPTAQFALRQAKTLARNIHASLYGNAPTPFHFDSLGALCVVGHQTACAELTVPFARHKSVRFSGLLAWLMWRGIYLAKLPGLERKVRVLVDWMIELFFPRDIVQTIDISDPVAHNRQNRGTYAGTANAFRHWFIVSEIDHAVFTSSANHHLCHRRRGGRPSRHHGRPGFAYRQCLAWRIVRFALRALSRAARRQPGFGSALGPRLRFHSVAGDSRWHPSRADGRDACDGYARYGSRPLS